MSGEFVKIVLNVRAGSSIGQTTAAAIKASVEYGSDVEFTFNDSLWRVAHADLLLCVKNVGLAKENPIKDKKEFT